MKYNIIQPKKTEPHFSFAIDLEFSSKETDYDTPKRSFKIRIEDGDIEQFIEEIRVINYFSGRKYIHLVKEKPMFTKYLQPRIEEETTHMGGRAFEGFYPKTPLLVFVNEFGIECPVEAEWDERDDADFEDEKERLRKSNEQARA